MKREDAYYRAVLARDPRFDGKFFVGVKTTGIYCRPICPARPKRENVEFFSDALAAERSGYRPCLRCRPESAPRSPAWIGKTAIVRRAVRAIDDSLDFDEDRFAERFGVTARHLRRLFVEEIGKTPKRLAFENRLNLARKLLVETALPVSEVAFGAGFRSIRRFNDAFKDRFHRTPGEIRARRAAGDVGEGLQITLPYRPPFDFESLLRTYESHRVADLERFTEVRMDRIVEFEGKVGRISVEDEPARHRVRVRIDFPDASAIHAIIARVRALFDLDSDPVVVANSLESDPIARKLLRRRPGIRLPSGWDPFEVAAGTILGQFVSVAAGRALVANLVEIAGRSAKLASTGETVRLFPSPRAVADADLSRLKTTRARRETLQAFARAVADGKLSLEPAQDVDAFRRALLAIRGIGPWTANYMALRVLRHTDAFPETDLILARAMAIHPRARIEKMRPWRGYAAALFWREYADLLKKKTKRTKTPKGRNA